MSVICLRRQSRCRGRLFVATFAAAIIFQVVHSRNYTSQEQRQLQAQDYFVDEGPPITCSFGTGTYHYQVDGFTQGEGLVFAMKSKDSDDNGVKILSLGFHVPDATSRNVDFQVYALKQDGYYADPIRNSFNEGVSYDYRGKAQFDEWEMISDGTIRKSDLIASDTNPKANEPDFYKIPPGTFAATEIPPNGGVRSFYISTSLLYTDPTLEKGINDDQLLVGVNDPASPKLLIGEGASGFSDTKFMYKTRQFVGKFFYQTECATEAPSLSLSPSTSKPTSSSPSFSPSDIPTKTPTPPAQPAGAEAALSFPLLECDPNQVTVPQEVQDAVSEQVTDTVTNGKDAEDFDNFSATVVEAKVRCDQRRLARGGSQHNRLLQSQSSAMEFSLVITGDYRSPDGKPPDLGSVVEDSINADAAEFTKELKDRIPNNPLLQQAMEPQVKARTLDEDDLEKFENDAFEVTVIAIPSPSLTETSSDKTKVKTALLIVILIVSGVMALLAAFLLFRHAERRAVENRRKKMERTSEQRLSELKEDTMKQQWEKENSMRMASNIWKQKKNQSDYPPHLGGAPPQHQEYTHTQDHYQDNYEEDEY